MRKFDGLLTGFLIGALMTAGVWVFVESDRQPTDCSPAGPPRRAEIKAKAPSSVRPAEPVAHEVAVARRRGPRHRPTMALPEVAPAAPAAPLRAGILERVDEYPGPPGAGPRRLPEQPPVIRPRAARRPFQIAVAVGGGVETSLSSAVGTAAQWNARVLVDPFEHVGLELGYAGTSGPRLATSSVEAVAKWYPRSGPVVRHYLFAGVGWRRFHSPLNVDVATLPLGLGLAYTRGAWRAETRLTLRLVDRQDLHSLGTTADVGWTF